MTGPPEAAGLEEEGGYTAGRRKGGGPESVQRGRTREGGGRAVVFVRPPNRPSGVQSGSMRNSREMER